MQTTTTKIKTHRQILYASEKLQNTENRKSLNEMQSNRNFHSLLMKMKNVIATLEDSSAGVFVVSVLRTEARDSHMPNKPSTI